MSNIKEVTAENTEIVKLKICRKLLSYIKMRQSESKEVNLSMYVMKAESITESNEYRREAILYNERNESDKIMFCINEQKPKETMPIYINRIVSDLAKISIKTVFDANGINAKFMLDTSEKDEVDNYSLAVEKRAPKC